MSEYQYYEFAAIDRPLAKSASGVRLERETRERAKQEAEHRGSVKPICDC